MKMKFGKIKTFLFLLIATISVYAVEPLPSNLINASSQPGLVLIHRNINPNLVKLLSHFTTQETVTYCGVASAVMVLNSTNKIPPLDSLHAPYRYFNQHDFFNDQVKQFISPEIVQKQGLTLSELTQAIQTYGLNVKPYFANEVNIIKFRTILKTAIANQQFIIVNFLRSAMQQQGGGHHSPVAAYDAKTDRFLILDVARYKYPAYWVKTEDLWNAVNTQDEGVYRGFIIIG